MAMKKLAGNQLGLPEKHWLENAIFELCTINSFIFFIHRLIK
ncbi:MAG: hypothetical protein PHD95_04380 [Candidatus ainarchaeum sp.]|nr:hypothetical protein [Candidatus ainarchaeum sp.]